MRAERRRPIRVHALGRLLTAWSCAGAAWLAALAHLVAALHFALVSHEVCATHGELVHGSPQQQAEPRTAERMSAALPASAHAEHEHCPLFGRRHEQHGALDAQACRVTARTAEPELAAADGVEVTPSRAEQLRTAPKQSPPA